MSSLCFLRPRQRPVVVVERVVVAGQGLVLDVQVDLPRERGRSLLTRWLPAASEVPALLTRMTMMLLLLVLPVAAVVVVLPVALAQEEVPQVVLLVLALHRLDSVQARLHLRWDLHLDVPALLVDELLVGVPVAQVVVALLVHCLDVVLLPIDIRRVLRYVQCVSVVSEGLCCILGRSTPVQSPLVVRLSTGSLLHVCVHVGTCLLATCSLCK